LGFFVVEMGIQPVDQFVEFGEGCGRGGRRYEVLQVVQEVGDLVVLGLEAGDGGGEVGVTGQQGGEQACGFAGVVEMETLAESQAVDAELGA
jgi:hypothetical protein